MAKEQAAKQDGEETGGTDQIGKPVIIKRSREPRDVGQQVAEPSDVFPLGCGELVRTIGNANNQMEGN